MIMRIADRRKKMNLTQEQLAQRLDLDRTTVVKWETGKSFPRPDMLVKLTEIFGCTADELLGIDRRKPAEEEKPETRGQEISVRMSEAFADARKRQEA